MVKTEGILFEGAERFPKQYYSSDKYETRNANSDRKREAFLKQIEPHCREGNALKRVRCEDK